MEYIYIFIFIFIFIYIFFFNSNIDLNQSEQVSFGNICSHHGSLLGIEVLGRILDLSKPCVKSARCHWDHNIAERDRTEPTEDCNLVYLQVVGAGYKKINRKTVFCVGANGCGVCHSPNVLSRQAWIICEILTLIFPCFARSVEL